MAIEKQCPDCKEWMLSQGLVNHLRKTHDYDNEEEIGHIAETAPQRKVGEETGVISEQNKTEKSTVEPSSLKADKTKTPEDIEQPKAPEKVDGVPGKNLRALEERMYEEMATKLEVELDIAPGIGNKDQKVGAYVVNRFRDNPQTYGDNSSELYRLISSVSKCKQEVVSEIVTSVYRVRTEYNLEGKRAIKMMPHTGPRNPIYNYQQPDLYGQNQLPQGYIIVFDQFGQQQMVPANNNPMGGQMGSQMMSTYNPQFAQNNDSELKKMFDESNHKFEEFQKESIRKSEELQKQHKEDMDRNERERKEEKENFEREKKDSETNTKIDKLTETILTMKDTFQTTVQDMKDDTQGSIGGLASEHERQMKAAENAMREIAEVIKDKDHKQEKENIDRRHRDDLRDQDNKNDKRFQDLKEDIRKSNNNPPKSLLDQMQEVNKFQETVGSIASDMGYSKSSGKRGDILGNAVVKAVETAEKLVDAAVTGGSDSVIRSAPVGEFHAINQDKVEMLKENARRQKEAREKAMQEEINRLATEKNRLEIEQADLIHDAQAKKEQAIKGQLKTAKAATHSEAVIVEKKPPPPIQTPPPAVKETLKESELAKTKEVPKKPEEPKKEPIVVEKVKIKPLPEKKIIPAKTPEKKIEKKKAKKVTPKIKITPPTPPKESKKPEELIKHG